MDSHGRIYDYCGGLEDIDQRRVRFIGDAATRIARITCAYSDCFAFTQLMAKGLSIGKLGTLRLKIARDSRCCRANAFAREMLKLLVARDAAQSIELMSDCGILQMLLGGIGICARLQKVASIQSAHGLKPDAVLRLTALAVLVEDDAERLRDRLRLSNAEETRLAAAARVLVEMHGEEETPLPNELYRFSLPS